MYAANGRKPVAQQTSRCYEEHGSEGCRSHCGQPAILWAAEGEAEHGYGCVVRTKVWRRSNTGG